MRVSRRVRKHNRGTSTLTAELETVVRAVVSLPDGLRAAALQLGRLQGDGVDVGVPLRELLLWVRGTVSVSGTMTVVFKSKDSESSQNKNSSRG